ncbi:MAG TPA: ribonucleoside-triphosphate reductase [Thermococcus sp.]|nr:MAG: ribonucleoside-triphosphate reductase [Archaeoglobales archaeon ex4484_92]RLF76158.1 MAG: ribonucleoside-triphosphate reductase [Thermococci archaeon]RLF80941.1 MAG: ribonucleoside-triphosphate reductase [Thermococci archaeon]RLF86878.1 MAG: ribonucleoside-triphosphate reductase [Thermococci archaeon]HDH43997.1 ribonucleoside-triphosphate reductase [Thermococcus sp.]
MEFKDKIKEELDNPKLWIVITFKTPHGPGETMDKLASTLEELGWTVTFKANWWTADIPYGLIRIDITQDEKEKIVLGRWILGRKCELLGIENMDLEKGKSEFYRLVNGITSTLIYDPVIRTMRGQY